MENRISGYSWQVGADRVQIARDIVGFCSAMIRIDAEMGASDSSEIWKLRITRQAALALLRDETTKGRLADYRWNLP